MSTERPNHCDGFARSQAIRRVLAGGRSRCAREWDSRMPIPAGVGIDRRRFLAGAIGGMAVGLRRRANGSHRRHAGRRHRAAATLQPSNSPILISLFLQGGIDSLSLLAPAGDPLYEKLRPTLAVAPGDRRAVP